MSFWTVYYDFTSGILISIGILVTPGSCVGNPTSLCLWTEKDQAAKEGPFKRSISVLIRPWPHIHGSAKQLSMVRYISEVSAEVGVSSE